MHEKPSGFTEFPSKDSASNLTPLQLRNRVYEARRREKNRAARRARWPRTAEEIITTINNSGPMEKLVRYTVVPGDEIAIILERVSEEVQVPASMFSHQQFRQPLEILGGRLLLPLYNFAKHHENREGKNVVSFLLELAGIRATAEDVIKTIKLDKRTDHLDRVPWEEMRKLLKMGARDHGIQVEMMDAKELYEHYDFLDGRTLHRLHPYALKHPEKRVEETAMMFIRRKTGIQETSFPRADLRLHRIEEYFAQNVCLKGAEEINSEFIPWIDFLARLYENPFLNIEREEIESEAVVFLLEAFGKGLSEQDLVKGLHKHLEEYMTRTSHHRYEEKLLSTPVGKGVTLQDAIPARGSELEDTELSGSLLKSLKSLSSLQQRLVIGIVVDGKSLDELGEEFELDPATLEEHYNDALTLLKELMSSEDTQRV